MISGIDFSTPLWLVNFYNIIGTISLLLNSYVLFLVIFKSDKLDNFKYFLLAFQSSCLLVDVHLTLLMQPQPLHPIPAGFCSGLLGRNNWVSCSNLMTTVAGFISIQFAALTLCFLRKFVSIKKIERQELELWKQMAIVFSMVFLSVLIILYFDSARGTREEELQRVARNYPEYLQEFENLTNVAIYELNIFWLFMLSTVVLMAAWYGTIIFYSTRRIFEILGKFKTSMSAVTYRKHTVAIMSLIAQLITSVIGMFPPTLLAALLIIEFRYAQVTCRFLLMMFSTHCSVNAIVLIATTPPFRKFTLFWRNKKTTPLVVSTVRGNDTDDHNRPP